ncbi:MAG: LETM1-related biofilm-associated protein [Crocinitomicaceae bacterium]
MMNPSKAGWIKKYFSILDNYHESLDKYPGAILSTEELFYGYLQPTGVMYGYPTSLLFLENDFINELSREEAFKILLLEGLILTDHLKRGAFDIDALEDSLEAFVDFYEQTEIEHAKKGWFDFSNQTPYDKLESIISQRVDIKTNFSNKLWTTYLYNSLIFHDLILYNEFHDGVPAEKLKYKRQQLAADVIKIIAIAANADGELTEEEEAIFEVFMASAKLQKDDRDDARAYWEGEKGIEDLTLNYDRSWVINRYLMEVAVLTVWSDRVVVQAEKDFLEQLTRKLEIPDDERDKSFIAIQAFVMNNYETVPFLRGKNDAERLMDGATERWKNILGRNKDKLAAELKESKDLMALIAKSTTEELTQEEKEKARTQLKDLARTIPSLTLFMLPGGSLLLPIILKIIPDLVPTAFRSNQIEEEKPSEAPED